MGVVGVMRVVVVWEQLRKAGIAGPEQAPGPLGIPRVPVFLDHDQVSGAGMGYVPAFACVDVASQTPLALLRARVVACPKLTEAWLRLRSQLFNSFLLVSFRLVSLHSSFSSSLYFAVCR